MSESTTEDLGVSSAASPSTDSGLMESEYEDGDAEHGNGDGADEGSEDEAEPEQPVWIRSGRAQDRSELSKAVRSGSIQEVKALIAAGGTDWAAALNSRDNEDGLSPLLHAGMAGDSAMIRVLLELCLALPRHPVFSTLVTVVADALAQLADRRPPDVAGEEVRLRRLKAELAAEIGRTREGKNDTPQEKKRIRQRMIDHRSAYIREVEGFTDSLADFVALRHRFANEMAAGLGVIDTELASLDFGARNTPIDEGLGRAVREFQERAEEIERQFAAVRDETLALLGPTLKDADRDAVRELVERTRETLMGLAWEKVRGFQERQSRQGTEVVAGAERLRRTVELVCDWSTEDLDRWESVLVDWETVLKEAADEQQEYLERLVVELEDRVQTLRGQLKEDKGRMEAARNAGNAALVEQLRRQLSEMHADWQQAATTLDEYRKLMGDVEKVRSEIGANDSASQVAARRDEDLAREYGGALRDPMEDDDMVHVKDDFADRVATHLKMIGMKGSSSLPSAKGMQGGLPNGFPGTYQPLAPPGRMNGSGQEDDGDYRRQARVIDQNLFADF
ncbi:hypothetical protein DFJ74DRAFT_664764 [Hyaloraphidium curvatum]|nr:hypothetical protein DFJ74DRAFT_664764 [Hyaloraphidium curvatum]